MRKIIVLTLLLGAAPALGQTYDSPQQQHYEWQRRMDEHQRRDAENQRRYEQRRMQEQIQQQQRDLDRLQQQNKRPFWQPKNR